MPKALVLAAAMLTAAAAAHAAASPAACVITLAKVELKHADGRWVTVLEPDHPVDIVREEPSFALFNDGRVPAGAYVNFRITLTDRVKITTDEGVVFRQALSRPGRGPEITASGDLAQPVRVGRGSFIGGRFGLDLRASIGGEVEAPVFTPPKTVEWAELTVDEDARRFSGDGIRIGYA